MVELLWQYYGDGVVVGAGVNAHAAREGVIFLKESHDLEGEEEIAARRDISTILARLGITLSDEDLEDLADDHSLVKAINAALTAAERPERAHLRYNKYGAIAVILLREKLVPGPLAICSP